MTKKNKKSDGTFALYYVGPLVAEPQSLTLKGWMNLSAPHMEVENPTH